MGKPKLLIFTALRMEARAVARALGLRREPGGDGCCGSVGPFDVHLTTVGLRAAILAERVRAAPRQPPVDVGNRGTCFLVAGLGGALAPGLKVGDVVIDWPWPDRAVPVREGWAAGRIHTAPGVVPTAADKARLFETTGAAAVDMEQNRVREILRWPEVPMVGVRAISDAADQDVDPAVLRLVDDTGKPKVRALVGYLARNPGRVLHLRRLGKASRLALGRLGEAVRAIVGSPAFAEVFE